MHCKYRNTVRPVWVSGPFVSPYNNALNFDNTICVASGIGITPALSIIRAHKESRRINLVWACRDSASESNSSWLTRNCTFDSKLETSTYFALLSSVLEFFMDHLYLNNEGGWILIFYTGEEKLNPAIENRTIIIKRRPDLHRLIPNIIYGIESGIGIPEPLKPSEKTRVKGLISFRLNELEEMGFAEEEIIEELTLLAHESGFLLSNLISESNHDSRKSLLEVVRENFSLHHNLLAEPSPKNGIHQRRSRTLSNAASMLRSSRVYNQGTIVDSGYYPWENQEGSQGFVKSLSKSVFCWIHFLNVLCSSYLMI